MPLNLGDTFPNFDKDTSDGKINFYEWAGPTSWVCFVSHPADFTPVCTTELGALAKLVPEFAKRNCKVIAISCNDADSHAAWAKDILAFNEDTTTKSFPFPIVADQNRELAKALGMIDPEEVDSKGLPMTCRAVFIVSPDKKVKLSILYPATTGRNMPEILRVLDSLQLTAYDKVATPVNWKSGENCMVLPSIKSEDLKATYPKGVRIVELPSGKQYLRYTPDPIA